MSANACVKFNIVNGNANAEFAPDPFLMYFIDTMLIGPTSNCTNV